MKQLNNYISEKLYIGKNFKIDDKIFNSIMDICKREHKNWKSEEVDKIVKDWIRRNDVEEFFIMVNEPQWFDLEKKCSKQELEHIVRSGAFADTAYKTVCKEENKDTTIKGICTIYSHDNTIVIDYGGDDFYVIKKQHVQQ